MALANPIHAQISLPPNSGAFSGPIDFEFDGVLSANCAEHALHRIGQFRFVDDQRAVGGFGRVRRPVARLEVGNQLVNEDQSRQADRR
jgi:hypothetical protein